MKIPSRKNILAFGFLALAFGLQVPAGRAEPGDNNFYTHIDKIIVTMDFATSATNQKEMEETNDFLRNHPLPKSINFNLQQLAFNYIQARLDEKLRKCIDVIAPTRDHESDYAINDSNLFLTIEYNINQSEVDGKTKLLGSLYLRETRPPNKNWFIYTSTVRAPAQAIVLDNNPTQVEADLKTAIEQLLKGAIGTINSTNVCKGS
jgi:hypothetical protein